MFRKFIAAMGVLAVGAIGFSLVGSPASARTWVNGSDIRPNSVTQGQIGKGGVSGHAKTPESEIQANSIGQPDIGADGVSGHDGPGDSELQAGTVGQADLSSPLKAWITGLATTPGPAGPKGDKGDTGSKGDKGDIGEPGVSGLHADAPYGAGLPGQDSSSTTVPAGQTKVVWTSCADGESALGGGFRIGDLANESFSTGTSVAYPDLQVVASEAAYYKNGELVNGSVADPVNANLSFRPNAWAVTVHNAGATDSVARAWVTCAKVAQ